MGEQINLAEWYNPKEAAQVLTRRSGKEVNPSYLRKLAQYGKVRSLKISERASLYRKEDVDKYIVEERGTKSGRAKRGQASKQKSVA